MFEKYELLEKPKNIQKQLLLNDLCNFIKKVFENIELKLFFLSFETTLFIYNCIINSTFVKNKWDINEIKPYIFHIYEKYMV